jgi:hypothetical protein
LFVSFGYFLSSALLVLAGSVFQAARSDPGAAPTGGLPDFAATFGGRGCIALHFFQRILRRKIAGNNSSRPGTARKPAQPGSDFENMSWWRFVKNCDLFPVLP